MLAAAIVAVATSLLMCISTDANIQTGYHIWDLKPQDISKPLESAILAMATQLLFVPITALTKVSILLTYLKIFPSNSNKHFCYTMLAFTTMWSFAAFLWALFQCKPIESFWTVSQLPTRHCVDLRILYYTTGGLNILSDFMVRPSLSLQNYAAHSPRRSSYGPRKISRKSAYRSSSVLL
jgi:hypothetical protein